MAEARTKLIGGTYAVDAVIGAGGMGVVYAATHWLTGERVAIKMLHQENENDTEPKRRFIREARAAADLNHPNIIRLLDLGEDDDHGLYMVLELLVGETLEEHLDKVRRLTPTELAEVLLPIIHAAAAAHDCGVVHRDLKPANIFLHRGSAEHVVPKLLDFGIARVIEGAATVGAAGKNDARSTRLTRAGQALGTPDYMSPEQAYGDDRLSPATDVWSMGAIMYRALSGASPFARASLEATMMDVASATYTPLKILCPDVPAAAALQDVIARALTRDVAKRTSRMDELLEDFARAVELDPQAVLARHGLAWPRVTRPPHA